jgi:hypothetical protein
MKAGYQLAAWRLFQPTLRPSPPRGPVPTWADAELAATPFAPGLPKLPIVQVRGSH